MEDPKTALRALRCQERPKYKSARVKTLLPEIDACLAAGFSYVEVAHRLSDSGVEISGRHLATIVKRVRKSEGRPSPATAADPIGRSRDYLKQQESKRLQHDPLRNGKDLI